MFFFQGYTPASLAAAVGLLAALLLVNEVTRRSRVASALAYVVVPVAFTLFLWPRTAGGGSNSGYWFAWVKTYSALAGVVGFMLIRYVKRLQDKRVALAFPAFILILNIAEAIYREFEISALRGVVQNGLMLEGGAWNVMNGVAGILLVLSMSGFLGIRVAKTKSQDMVWPDQLWFWIVAYGLWNLSYCYNCISNRSFYAGFVLLVAGTLADFVIRQGAWLQHRAQTLALFAMFSLTYPGYADMAIFSITSTQAAAPKLALAIASLAFNAAVFAYQVYSVVRSRKNPLTQDIHARLAAYRKALSVNGL